MPISRRTAELRTKDSLITNHDFIRANDGRCGFTWGAGPDRERCGNAQEHHAASEGSTGSVIVDQIAYEERVAEEQIKARLLEAIANQERKARAAGIDRRPHSRACGIAQHDHGWSCSVDCPTCHGRETLEPAPFTEPHVSMEGHEFVPGQLGTCIYSYDLGSLCGGLEEWHKAPDPLTTHEATKRVLFHIVNAYQKWRATKFLPNELTDDAVRIGEQHLRLVGWFPENEGWLPNGTDQTPNDGAPVIILKNNVLTLIDKELERLRLECLKVTVGTGGYWSKRKARAWANGVRAAREVAADKLQDIRDAYVAESIVRETEALRLYDVPEAQIDA